MKTPLAALALVAPLFVVSPAVAQDPLPPGPYRAACSDFATLGPPARPTALTAWCKDYGGRAKQTRIALPCYGEIGVTPQGDLICRPGGGPQLGNQGGPRGPGRNNRGPGDYNPYPQDGRGPPPTSARIRLFALRQYDGRAVVVTNEVRDLRQFDFDDTASSLRVERGRWQVCDEPNFNGRCEIVEGEIRNLVAMRMDDKISSLRPWWNKDR